ncbi:hypothetical protein [Maribacter sp.]|uniref:hypothetical protein n=1 Tax=Maribacter sp. TaxID=1897614 RepID=UPI0025C4A5DC|nr:hypothetical protein [Maribacter sp.]
MELKEILKYENEDVVYRFQKLFEVKEEEAIELFRDTLRWLYAIDLNNKLFTSGEIDFTIGINDDLLILDEMWHNFILFTKEYDSFCNDYFGYFIHHQPMTKIKSIQENDEIISNYENIQNERKLFFKKQYSFIYDLLGKDILVKWHKEWPIKYSIDKIRQLRK